MKSFLYIITLFYGLFSAAQISQAGANDFSTLDFARGYYLEIEGHGAIYSLHLPDDLYFTVRDSSFRDVAVFNGAGEPIAHEIRRVEVDSAGKRSKSAVSFFPLTARGDGVAAGELGMRVERNNSGTIISVEAPLITEGEVQYGEKLEGYLLDLSTIDHQISQLEFFWRRAEQTASTLMRVNLYESSELQNWRRVVSGATLADLVYGNQRIEKRIVQFARQPKRYVKMNWSHGGQPIRLEKVFCYSRAIVSPTRRKWFSLPGGKNQQGEITEQLFESPYRISVNSLAVDFSLHNSLAKFTVESRGEGQEMWRKRCEQVFYRLSVDDVVLENEPCAFAPTDDVHWRLTAYGPSSTNILKKGNLSLKLGWSPTELIFLAQGEPPFLLAYGSGRVAASSVQAASVNLTTAIPDISLEQVKGTVHLGKKVTLGGEYALHPPAVGRPWKKWLLWGVLLIGVAILAFMVRRLVGEIQQRDKQ